MAECDEARCDPSVSVQKSSWLNVNNNMNSSAAGVRFSEPPTDSDFNAGQFRIHFALSDRPYVYLDVDIPVYYIDLGWGAKYCIVMSMSVWHTHITHQIFIHANLWPWLGPLLTELGYVKYFRFRG